MKNTSVMVTILALVFVVLHTPSAFGWGVNTHEIISEVATNSSALAEGHGNFIQSNLGLELGLNATVAETYKEGFGLNPIDEIQIGAEKEDAKCYQDNDVSCVWDYYGRFCHHLHNPIENWEDAGLSDIVNGRSSLLWAQDDGQSWSWNNIRDIYYQALTSTDLNWSERRFKLAQVFKGIGHQMHLIQDMGVPAHTRNDNHGLNAPFESWAEWAKDKLDRLKNLALAPEYPSDDLGIWEPYENETELPVGKLTDTNTYDGTNPSANNSIGLSEFTNANFFSSDTIFAREIYSEGHKHYFPYPRRSETNVDEFINEEDGPLYDTTNDNKKYVISLDTERMKIEHFVVPTYYTREIDLATRERLYCRTFTLNKDCHADYAKKLVPRVSGYSTELINYFFRGSIDISLPDTGVYAMLDPDSEVDSNNYDEHGFDKIKLKAENTSLYDEQLNDGTIELVVKYQKVLDYPFQNEMNREYSDYHYTVVEVESGRQDIPNEPVTLEFDLSSDSISEPIPLNAVNLSLYLVYRGQIGAEENGVAVGYKDISEPTPFAVYNTCDRICMNGQWYEAGSQEAIDIVDKNSDGYANPEYCDDEGNCYDEEHDVYPHALNSTCLFFHPKDKLRYPSCESTSEEEGKLYIDRLEPAETYRCFILSDYEYGYTTTQADRVLPNGNNHCPPGFPYTDYSWKHGSQVAQTYIGIGAYHKYSRKYNKWILQEFWEKYDTQSVHALHYDNTEYPKNATEHCEFKDL